VLKSSAGWLVWLLIRREECSLQHTLIDEIEYGTWLLNISNAPYRI
jgi:hypothetical protein